MVPRRDLLKFGLAALSASTIPRPAIAQASYPERPIRLVIPYPPGGVNDAVGRPWADKMKSLLGTIVVENIGGAGSSLGAAAVARAQPDGYTILLGGSGALVVNPIAASRALYDPIMDFEPISILGFTGIAIVVHPSVPVRTLNELINYARSNPGKLSYGSAGVGSGNHLAGELFKSLIGNSDIVHVPYRGAGPVTNDLISGQIPIGTPVVTGQIVELHRSGRLRILAVTTPSRALVAPEIPTAVEAGLPGMIAQSFIGLYAPARTPKGIIERISEATRAAMRGGDFQRSLIALGVQPELDSSPDKTRQFIVDEIARWTPVIKAIGLKLD
jgi:tripartite-type tricarboxylate transporter receptor subunit TctC